MNNKKTNNNIKVVLSVGDESGIGPEIILKALCSDELPDNIDFTLVGSKKNLFNTYKNLKALGLEKLANPNSLKIYDLEISPSDDKSKSLSEYADIAMSLPASYHFIPQLSQVF